MSAYLLDRPEALALKAGTLNQLVLLAKPQPAPWPTGGFLAGISGLWITHKNKRLRVTYPQSELIDQVCPLGKVGEVVRMNEALALIGTNWCYEADEKPIAIRVSGPTHAEALRTEMIAWAHHRTASTCPARHMPEFAVRFKPVIKAIIFARVSDLNPEDYAAFAAKYESQKIDTAPWVWLITIETKLAKRGRN